MSLYLCRWCNKKKPTEEAVIQHSKSMHRRVFWRFVQQHLNEPIWAALTEGGQP